MIVPQLTIIICTYNRSRSLHQTIASVLSQKNLEKNNYDILVIDNNSTDDTASTVANLAHGSVVDISYVFEQRQGKTFALNTGIRSSRGQLLAFLDDDVVVHEGWLDKVFLTFAQHPACDVFGGRILPLLHEGSTLPVWVRQQEPHYNAEGPLGDHNKGDQGKCYYEQDMGTPCGANFFVRRKVFEEHGLYNDKLNKVVKDLPMAEDSEFCFRLKKKSIPMLYIPDAIVYHDTPPEKLTKSYFRSYIFRMSRAYVHAAKLESGTKRVMNIPIYFFRTIVERFFGYVASIVNREGVDLRFSKQLELLQALAICYWYFTDRDLLNND